MPRWHLHNDLAVYLPVTWHPDTDSENDICPQRYGPSSESLSRSHGASESSALTVADFGGGARNALPHLVYQTSDPTNQGRNQGHLFGITQKVWLPKEFNEEHGEYLTFQLIGAKLTRPLAALPPISVRLCHAISRLAGILYVLKSSPPYTPSRSS